MADQPQDPQQQETAFEIQIPPELEPGAYANFLSVWHTPLEFTLDFAATQPSQQTDTGMKVPCRVVARGGSPQPDERLLDEVLGEPGVAQQVEAEAVDLAAKRGVQSRERLRTLAVCEADDELRVLGAPERRFGCGNGGDVPGSLGPPARFTR